jgi:hypothetical protein
MICYQAPNGCASESSRAQASAAPAAAAGEAAALARQGSWGWLLRRWLVLHADMVVGAACFAAALQAPSALGLVLAAGSLIAALQHGYSNHSIASTATRRWNRRASASSLGDRAASTDIGSNSAQAQGSVQPGDVGAASSGLPAAERARAFKAECAASDRSLARLSDAVTALLQVLVAAWLLAQYLLQVAWLRGLIFQAAPPLLPWLLLWLGLPVAGDEPMQVPHLTLEGMLRMKALVLVATALRRKAQRWQRKLPAAVVTAADAHWPCPLFWPPHAVRGAGIDVSRVPGAQGDLGGSQMHTTQPDGAVELGGADALAWEDLEPVLKRAEQLVSPVKALFIKVSFASSACKPNAAGMVQSLECWHTCCGMPNSTCSPLLLVCACSYCTKSASSQLGC